MSAGQARLGHRVYVEPAEDKTVRDEDEERRQNRPGTCGAWMGATLTHVAYVDHETQLWVCLVDSALQGDPDPRASTATFPF